MHKLIQLIFIITILTIFIIGCQTKKNMDAKGPITHNQSKEQSKDFAEQIEGKYWKLITLYGKPVVMAKNQEREVHFKLSQSDKVFSGFTGCNSISGSYHLEQGFIIRFSQILTTLMACPDIDINEQELFEVFELTNNYTISNGNLSLNIGKRAPLAVFKAVYFD